MNARINVPRLDWLIGGSRIGGRYNKYFGSVGTDPEKGIFGGERIFNYTVGIEKLDEDEVIRAAWYPGTKSIDNTDDSLIEKADFELSESSLEKIRQWLEERLDKFYSPDGK